MSRGRYNHFRLGNATVLAHVVTRGFHRAETGLGAARRHASADTAVDTAVGERSGRSTADKRRRHLHNLGLHGSRRGKDAGVHWVWPRRRHRTPFPTPSTAPGRPRIRRLRPCSSCRPVALSRPGPSACRRSSASSSRWRFVGRAGSERIGVTPVSARDARMSSRNLAITLACSRATMPRTTGRSATTVATTRIAVAAAP